MIKMAARYNKFPLFDTLSIVVSQLAWNAPIILFTSFFNPAICGLFAKAHYLLLLPTLIIAQSVSQVFLQESASARIEGKDIARLVEGVFSRMITIGTLPFALLAVIGPELFGFFLGARWTESGVYAQIITPHLFLFFLAESITTLFGTLGKQELNLLLNMLRLALRLVILTFGGLVLRDVRLTLFIYMVANSLIALWRISMLMRATKASARRAVDHLIRSVGYVLPSIIPIVAMKWWLGLEAIYLVAAAPIFSIPYIVLILRHDLELRDLISKYLCRVRLILRKTSSLSS
jgi:O-antigen/teichoic acid export membrane protein